MSTRGFILFLILIALISGIFWSHKTFGTQLPSGDDSIDYNIIALNITDNKSFAPSSSSRLAAYEPLYSYFLAGVYKVFGRENFDAVRIIQIIIFSLIALLTYLISRMIVGEWGGRFSGILTALFFPLASSAGYLHREVLFTFLIILTVFLFCKWQESKKNTWIILSGIFLGFSVLINSIVQFLFPFLVIVLFVLYRNRIFEKKNILAFFIFLLSFLTVLYVWPVSSNNAEEGGSIGLKIGGALSRKAEMMQFLTGEKYLRHLGGQLFGYYFTEKEGFEPSEILGHPRTTKNFQNLLDEGYSVKDASDKLAEENSKYIFSHPGRFISISVLDFLQFNGPMLFNPKTLQIGPMQNLFIEGSYSGLSNWQKVLIFAILRFSYWIFFGFVLYGFFRALKRWREFVWIIAIIVYFNFAYTTVFGLPRYAIPIYPLYIIIFTYGLFGIQKLYSSYKQKRESC